MERRQDCSISGCYDPNEELRLRRVIEAIGTFRFETKIRALGCRVIESYLLREMLAEYIYIYAMIWFP